MTTRSAGAPSRSAGRGSRRTDQPRRPGRERLDGAHERQAARRRPPRARSRAAVSIPEIPLLAQPELDVLVDLGVRRVVRGDGVGGAVRERRQAGAGVLGATQRRVDPERRVERRRLDRAVGPRIRAAPSASSASQAQRRDPAIHSSVSARWCGVTSQVTGRPATFARPDEVERRRRRHVRQVQARARHVPDDVGEDRDRRATEPASAATGQPLQPEHGRDEPVVRLGALGERGVLGVIDDRQPERTRVGERVSQERGATGRAIRRPRSPRPRHRPARRAARASRRPARPSRRRGRGRATGEPAAAAAARTRATTPGSSIAGVVLGMSAHRREPAVRRGRQPGGDRLGVLVAGLPEVRVEVDEPGARSGRRRA